MLFRSVMIYPYWIAGFMVYFALAHLTFGDCLKDKSWFPIAVGSLSLINGIMWGLISQRVRDATELAVLGFYWDIMITLVFLAVPLIWYGANFSYKQLAGLVLIVIGMILLD